MTEQSISVLAAPLFDPGAGRITMTVAAGLTISEIVAQALPHATFADLTHMRVVMISPAGYGVAEPRYWSQIRPKPGVRVVIRIVPGKDVLKNVLMVVVAVAAAAIGQFWVAPLLGGGVIGAIGGAIAAAGITVLGSLLVNALIPPPKVNNDMGAFGANAASGANKNQVYQITGWKNRVDPNGIVPDAMGKLRYAPPFGSMTYTEIVGDIQYVRAVFCCGYGGDYGLSLSDFQIGDTALSDYDEVQTEVREGLSSDAPLSLYPNQVVEESVGAELVRPVPRDDQGNVIGGGGRETPVIRNTGADATGASVIIGFPSGLGEVDNKGTQMPLSCSIRIRQRLVGSGSGYSDVATLDVTASKFEGFYRQFTWNFPTRGRYEIEVTRMTDENTSTQAQSRSSWLVLQTLRPEYPFNFGKPLAFVALRVKATYQLNGALDNFNAMVSRRCKDWDQGSNSWVVRETSNPASLFRYALQSHANPKPVPDSGIDLELLQGWHNFCVAKGLKYDEVAEAENKQIRDLLAEIASAGRASQRHDGVKYGVVIDRPRDLVPVDHVNGRNSWQFKANRIYIKPPHAFRVQFLDATNDYKPAERIIPWPGHSGPITLTEQLELPGKTDPREIWIEARRRMYEALYRVDSYTCMQDGAVRTATRGDVVMLNTDVLERTQSSARVKSVTGKLIELDDDVTMLSDRTYAIRFRVFANDADTIGTSVVKTVVTVAGVTKTVRVTDLAGGMPEMDDIIHFGPSLTESLPVIVTRVEAGQDFSSSFKMVDAAPIIDDLTDEEDPPAWSGRVGDDIGDNTGEPPTPRITSIRTGLTGAGIAGAFTALIVPGSGPIVSSTFRLQHRLATSSVWTTNDFPASNGGRTIEGYDTGDPVQIRVAAISPAGVVGAFTTPVTVTIGENDAGLPASLDDAMITIGPMLGGAIVMFSTTDDVATSQMQLYRSASSTLNRATDKIGAAFDVTPSRSYSIGDGDTTRENLLANGTFDTNTVWDLGSDWAIATGKASHVSGSASDLSQDLVATAGKYYRLAFTLSTVTAGNLTPRLSGGSTVNGIARSANGDFSDRVLAVTGTDTFAFHASSAFEGSVDAAVAFLETETCLSAGTYYYWLEPLNADGVAGPASGPIAVTIR